MASAAITSLPADQSSLSRRARALSAELGLPRLNPMTRECAGQGRADLLLTITPHGLDLRRAEHGRKKSRSHERPLSIDLARLDTSSGPGRSLQNPLLKAIGIRKGSASRPNVLDLTAGFGEDAWLMAAVGCRVTAVERHPVIFALLRDAVERAGQEQAQIAQRITVQWAEGRTLLGAAREHGSPDALPAPDHPRVIYLDPMFPGQRKTAERKAMRLARELVGADADAHRLFTQGLASTAERLVVKRPRRAEPFSPPMPVTSHEGKALRFDVYKPGG